MTQKAHLHLISWAVDRGYSFKVYGEGEYDGVHSTYASIKDNVEACDMGEMVLVEPTEDGKWNRLASFSYIFDYGQDPSEIICDYTDNNICNEWHEDYMSA